MSAVADVNEMQALCIDIADRLVGKGAAEKVRIPVLAEKIGISTNRALEFLRAKARRVDSWEKDSARKLRDKLERAERRQREHEHLAWLAEQTSGMGGSAADVLQHLLRDRGFVAGSVALSESEHDDQAKVWR